MTEAVMRAYDERAFLWLGRLPSLLSACLQALVVELMAWVDDTLCVFVGANQTVPLMIGSFTQESACRTAESGSSESLIAGQR